LGISLVYAFAYCLFFLILANACLRISICFFYSSSLADAGLTIIVLSVFTVVSALSLLLLPVIALFFLSAYALECTERALLISSCPSKVTLTVRIVSNVTSKTRFSFILYSTKDIYYNFNLNMDQFY